MSNVPRFAIPSGVEVPKSFCEKYNRTAEETRQLQSNQYQMKYLSQNGRTRLRGRTLPKHKPSSPKSFEVL
jgi:hypothetical protein